MAAAKKTNNTDGNHTHSGLYRSETNKILAGVCGGLGEYFAIDPSIIRIIFVVITLFGGSGILIYLILWLIIPARNSEKYTYSPVEEKAQKFAHDIKVAHSKDSRSFWGLILLGLGLAFLLKNFGIFDIFSFREFWPLLLIIIGLVILFRK